MLSVKEYLAMEMNSRLSNASTNEQWLRYDGSQKVDFLHTYHEESTLDYMAAEKEGQVHY